MGGALGHLFPKLLGETWEARVRDGLLRPLGMSPAWDSLDASEAALPYVGIRRIDSVDMTAVAAAGALRLSIDDMSRWLGLLVNGGTTPEGTRLLSEASLARLFEQQIVVEKPNPLVLQGLDWLEEQGVGYGLGWFLGSTNGLRVAYHPGYIDGFSSLALLVPKKRLGLVALSNTNLNGALGPLLRELLENVLGDQVAQQEPQLPSDLLAAVGTYENPMFGSVGIELDGSLPVLSFSGHRCPLRWTGDGDASIEAQAFGISIPLPVRFRTEGGVNSLAIPLSLEPRVPPQVFVRRGVD